MSMGTLGLAGLFVLGWASAFNAARIVALEWPPLAFTGVTLGMIAVLYLVGKINRKAPEPAPALH